MAATVAGIIANTVVSVKGQQDQKRAQQAAAAGQAQASIESAEQLGSAGRAAEQDLLNASEAASDRIRLGQQEATDQIQPFVDPGVRAFDQFKDLTLSGEDIGGPLAESIRLASLRGSQSPIFDTSPVVQRGLERQADINVSALTPGFLASLGVAGQQGLGAVGDVASIEQRGLESLSDTASGTGAQRASVLVGQVPQLSQQATGAGEARLLEQVVGQQGKEQTLESLANLAGQLRR